MTRNDLIDKRACIIADHLADFQKQAKASPLLSESKAATLAYRHARIMAAAITDEDARIARVNMGRAA